MSYVILPVLVVLHVVASAWINYHRGGSRGWMSPPIKIPGKATTGFIFALPVFYVDFPMSQMPPGLPDVMMVASETIRVFGLYLTLALSTIGTQWLGHGSWMDAGTWKEKKDNELLRYALRPLTWIGIRDGSPGYDFCGLTLKGAIMGAIPLTVFVYIDGWLAGAAAMAGFVSMPVWYFINNNWTDLWQKPLLGVRVYWAELFHGAAISVGYWAAVLS